MYFPRIAALGAVLVVTACEVPVSSSDPSLGVVSVAVQPQTATVLVGDSMRLSANLVLSKGNLAPAISWSSSDAALATVNSTGVVYGVATGAVVVRAVSLGKHDSAAVTIVRPSPNPVASVTVTPSAASLDAGRTLQLAVTLKDAAGRLLAGRTVTWATSSPAVATVSASGLVSGVAAGSATITATSETVNGTAAISVAVPASTPGTVSDLNVAAVSESSATLSFTEVSDGAGQPAGYDVRYGPGTGLTWGGTPSVTRGTCATPLAGNAIGAKRTCTVLGLVAGGTYSFETVAYRGALKVNAVFGELSNVATGTTTASTAPVAALSVTPANLALSIGGVQQLSATPTDASGNALIGRTVTWTSSNAGIATVTSGGLVTGVAAGTATITATSEGHSGTSVATVSAASAGTVLLQENFQDAGLSGRGWYDTPDMPVTTAQHMPGATAAGEIHFTPGATGATFGGSARHLFTPTSTLYVSYWVKYSDNWVGSGSRDHPHEFYVLSNQDREYAPLADDWLTTYIETNFVGGAGTPRVTLQDNLAINRNMGTTPLNLIGVTEDRSVSGCNGVIEATTNLFSECYGSGTYNDKQFNRVGPAVFQAQSGTGYKGNWNHVEVYLQMNSIVGGVGVPDGIVQYWFNGTPVIDRHDVLFRTGARANLAFAQFIIGPYIGGGGSSVDQTMWVDNLTLATSRP